MAKTKQRASASATKQIVLIVLVLFSLFGCVQNETDLHPNVIIIVSDDQGFGDIGYNGSEFETPNLDALAAAGVVLDQFHVFPTCSPTRAALLTGRNPNRFGTSNAIQKGEPGPPLDEHFMPESFRAAGYQTWIVGKWHLGESDASYLPNSRGFDYFYGSRISAVNYFDHTSWRYKTHDWFRNGEEVHEQGYTTDLIAEDAIVKIKQRDSKRPFLLFLAYGATHVPLQAPEALINKYAVSISDEKRRIYAAMVDAMDASIGKLIGVLEQENIRDHTLIVFISDNGGLEGRGGANNGSLRGGKGSPFEGGTRVPAFVNWPGGVPEGITSGQFVHAFDLFPTIAEAVNVKPQNKHAFDGKSLWHQLLGEQADLKPLGIAQVSMGGGSVWHEDWKLVENGDELLLFNISKDPNEETNLAARHQDRVSHLQAYLNSAKASVLAAQRPPFLTTE